MKSTNSGDILAMLWILAVCVATVWWVYLEIF